jgi:hypothetical protein
LTVAAINSPGHLLITRFSLRSAGGPDRAAGEDWTRDLDPLDPENLDFRFALFELVCLPGVLAQSEQDFDWVVIVDRELPASRRAQLEALLERRSRTHVHTRRSDEDLRRLGWLEPYVSGSPDALLTTLLDDDDAIPIDFVRCLQSHIGTRKPCPSLMTFGAKTSQEWDLYVTQRAPLGRLAPWHRRGFFRSAGFSLLSDRDLHDVSVLALSHRVGDCWFETARGEELALLLQERWGRPPVVPADSRIAEFQQLLTGRDDWRPRPRHDLCHDLSTEKVSVLQTNHFRNAQWSRLLEAKPGACAVTGRASFPAQFRLNLEVLDVRRYLFELSRSAYTSLCREAAREARGRPLVGLAFLARWTVWWLRA